MKRTVNFEGKKAFVGIDVHRNSFAVAVVCEERIVCSFSSPPDGAAVVSSVKRKVPGAELHFCYETGFSGFGLGRWLQQEGYTCMVVDPGSIEVSTKDKTVKTDRKDARKLATQLSQGRLASVYIPTEEEELNRLTHRTREQLVNKRKQTMNQTRSRLHQFGLMPIEHTGVLTIGVVKAAITDAPKQLVVVIETLLSVWEHLNEKIKELNQEIARTSGAGEELLRSIPGVGPLTAKTIMAELIDMARFSNGKQLVSYVGLNPGEHSSGKKPDNRGGITHQGSDRLRSMLVQSAWIGVGKDPYLKAIYQRLCIKKKKSVAIVAVARKMLLIMRSMLLTGAFYECRAVPSNSVMRS